MAYEMKLETGEEVAARIELNLSKKVQPFFFGVSNQALYIPRIKFIAKTDPYYFERVPLDQIRHVAVTRLRPYALWVLAVGMIAVGLLTTVWMIEQALKNGGSTPHATGWPIAVLVGGFLIPFAAKGRFGLEVWFNGGKYYWKPPLVVDRPSKQQVTDTFQTIVAACLKVGVPIADQRAL